MVQSLGNKGQGSFLSGDIPSIIMIVISITFFLSSIYMAMTNFEDKKSDVTMRAALVEAASTFLKANANIRPSDLASNSEYWTLTLQKIRITYGVEVYVELDCLDSALHDSCYATSGEPPPDTAEVLSRRFPISVKPDNSDLDVYAGLIKVSVFI